MARSFQALPIAILLLTLSILSFAIWVPLNVRQGAHFGLSSVAIGGKLTQRQAKVIDVASTAVFAPILVLFLNSYWFSIARVTVNNERTKKIVPLVTLIEASKIESGSYSPFTIIKLVTKQNPMSFLLGVLVLLSAIALSAFQNVIGYQAYITHTGTFTAKLHPLNDFEHVSTMDSIPSYSFDGTNLTTYIQADLNYTQKQQSDFVPQVNEVLTRIAFENALSKLDGGYYVGINATRASMSALPSKFVKLTDIPGYRLAIGCQARSPDRVSITTAGTYNVAIDSKFENSGGDESSFRADFPGRMDVYTNANATKFAFAAFETNQTQAFRVCLGRFVDKPDSLEPMPSPYGDITYKTYNMTAFGFQGKKATMSSWGMICNMTRETGLHNLSREEDLSWKIQGSTWSKSSRITAMLVGDWQKVLNFQTPTTNMPGLAPAFLSNAIRCPDPLLPDGQCPTKRVPDYQVYALNFLFAAGEIERIAYEVKNANSTLIDTESSSLRVQATESGQRYRMTYVPLILLAGLLSVLFAASISLALILISQGTMSYRTWRDVDTLRLMVDIVDGLHLHPDLKDLHGLSDDEMEERAKLCKVHYSEDLRDSKGVIRLCRFGDRIDMSECEGGKLVRTSNSGPVGSANTSSAIEASSDGLEDSVKGRRAIPSK